MMHDKAQRSTPSEFWPVWMQYLMSLVILTLAVGVRFALDPLLGDALPYTTLYAAVAFAAYYGGLGPALFAIFLGALAADYFFVSPRFSLNLFQATELVDLVFYIVASLLIAIFGSSAREARVVAESKSYEA